MSEQIASTVLITGATSYTARYLIQKLLQETNQRLLLAARDPEQLSFLHHPRIQLVKLDLTNPSDIRNLFRKHQFTQIIHLAAMARLGACEHHPMEAIRVNLKGALELINLAQHYQVESLLFTSSDLARNATSVVGMCKYLIEDVFRHIEPSKTRCCTLRLANVIDSPGSVTLLFKKQIQSGGPVTITHPDMSRRFISGERAARMIWEVCRHGHHNEVFVSTEAATNITELAHNMMKQLNHRVPIDFIGPKPGERLAELGYSPEETKTTGLKGLGILKTNPINPDETQRMLHHLTNQAKKANDHDIQEFLETLKIVLI